MAKPRIFISSTFYDLKQYRYNIEAFIKEIGYEPIMNDRGNIPYDKNQPLENSCYDEVTRCDILVGIIGNKYGTQSSGEDIYSISMKEITTAIKTNKQMFMFVEKSVLNENSLYKKNKEKEVDYVAVDDIRIHEFIEEIQALPMNNAIQPFETGNDIIDYLKEQFAGLFQRLLQEKAVVTEQTTYYDLKSTINEFQQLIENQKAVNNEFIIKFDSTLLYSNLVIYAIKNKIGLKKSTFFAKDKNALIEIFSYMNFYEDKEYHGKDLVLIKTLYEKKFTLTINNKAFDDNDNIKAIRTTKEAMELVDYKEEDDEDYIPF